MANRSKRIIDAATVSFYKRSPFFNQISSKPTSQYGFSSSTIFSANRNTLSYSTPNPHLLIRWNYSSSSSSSIFPSGFSNSRNFFVAEKVQSRLPFPDYNKSSKIPSPKTIFSQIFHKKFHYNSLIPFISKSQSSRMPLPFSSQTSLGFLNDKLSIGFRVPLGYRRCLSFKTSGFSNKFSENVTKTLVDKPMSAIRSAFVRYREAVGLQIEAFWRRNYLVLLGVGAFGLCMILWRVMFGIADTFIGFSEGMAKYGFLALSSAIVAFGGLYVRSRFTINPDAVYRIAMRKLNTSAGILEVMGAPLSGTDLRAYVMSSGGLRLKSFKPKFGGKRCFLIFPIRGSERKGLVSVEVKKKKGQYDMKLLAVDIPMSTGPDQRFFLIGDEEEYKVGGGLISELRDPVVKAMAAVKEFEAIDQREEEEDTERELEEVERKNREEIEKLEKGSS